MVGVNADEVIDQDRVGLIPDCESEGMNVSPKRRNSSCDTLLHGTLQHVSRDMVLLRA